MVTITINTDDDGISSVNVSSTGGGSTHIDRRSTGSGRRSRASSINSRDHPIVDPNAPISGGTYKLFNEKFCSRPLNPYTNAEGSQLGVRKNSQLPDHYKVRCEVYAPSAAQYRFHSG